MGETEHVRLTKLSTKGGCAAKWGPGELGEILHSITPDVPPVGLLGFETNDDAAVYMLREDMAAVLTVDFFTPVVDDPYEFGCVAAANALSDIFAMGATPHIALNLLALDSSLGTGVAADILRGGSDIVRSAGAFVAGGHTIDDDEPKYGLAVFGTAHPDEIIRNQGALPGDILFLTKPIGTGIMSAAYKIGEADEIEFRPVIDSMMELNAAGAITMKQADAHAATDVTGFGLAGHLHEMLVASSCAAVIDWNQIPLFPRVQELSEAYCRPARSFSIMDFAEPFIAQGTVDDDEFDIRMGVLCDPQTSGGLLVAVSPERAEQFSHAFEHACKRTPARIGEVCAGEPGTIAFLD